MQHCGVYGEVSEPDLIPEGIAAHPGMGEAVKEAALAVDGRPIHI